jgi:CubicO group peptidase (beta-lactamase class C family)
MNQRTCFFLGALFFFSTDFQKSSGATIQSEADTRIKSLEHDLEKLRKKYDVPGMSAAVNEGDLVIWQQGFGKAKIGGVDADPNTVYHLASLTKPFAAVVLLQLVQERKLDLNTPASDFGITFTNSRNITVRHILSHISDGEPGTRYKYDGARFRRLDKVIEKVTGKPFASAVYERVLQPLNLTNTSPNPQDTVACELAQRNASEFAQRLAQGYHSDGTRTISYKNGFSVSAGMVSTVGDIASFSMAWDKNELLNPELKELAWTAAQTPAGKKLAYGLGWFVYGDRHQKIVWHYGWWDGVSSLIVKVPARKLTFVLLANSDMLSRPFDLGGDNNVYRSKFAKAFLDAFL